MDGESAVMRRWDGDEKTAVTRKGAVVRKRGEGAVVSRGAVGGHSSRGELVSCSQSLPSARIDSGAKWDWWLEGKGEAQRDEVLARVRGAYKSELHDLLFINAYYCCAAMEAPKVNKVGQREQ